MKIALVAAEATPYAKVGGMADVVGALPKCLKKGGVEVAVFIPRYRGTRGRFHCQMKVDNKSIKIFRLGNYYFIDYPRYYQRAGIYGNRYGDYYDNCERFSFFCRAVRNFILDADFDIVHCNDWHTGLLPLYLRLAGAEVKTVFTIHNLGYQGIFPMQKIRSLRLPTNPSLISSIRHSGKLNFLKAGIIFSDFITTVSENYAREIQTKKFGFGLDSILRKRKGRLVGIVNGIDYGEWNPARDQLIYKKFTGVRGKRANKDFLCKKFGLEHSRPLLGMVSRVAGQKGFDILLEAIEGIIRLGYNFILLGTGDENYYSAIKKSARLFPNRISVNIRFDNRLAHQIYAGSDFFLMPSYYEPCGLGQMIALKYGSIPVVRRTGGLVDTIVPYDPRTGSGNGFFFTEYSSRALVRVLARAYKVYQNPQRFHRLVRAGMEVDFSWTKSAYQYQKLYQKLTTRG